LQVDSSEAKNTPDAEEPSESLTEPVAQDELDQSSTNDEEHKSRCVSPSDVPEALHPGDDGFDINTLIVGVENVSSMGAMVTFKVPCQLSDTGTANVIIALPPTEKAKKGFGLYSPRGIFTVLPGAEAKFRQLHSHMKRKYLVVFLDSNMLHI